MLPTLMWWNWHALSDLLSDMRFLTMCLRHSLLHSLTQSVWNMLYDTFSLTCSLWHILSDTFSLTCSLCHVLSNTFSLTQSLWHDISDTISLTCSLWNSNSPKHNENLTRSNLSDNTRKFACIFHHQSAVHISVYLRWPLQSTCLTSVYQTWFFNEGCPRIYRWF